MTRRRWSSLFAAVLVVLLIGLARASESFAVYFDLGPRLVQEFQGTYEFSYKRIEFIRTSPESSIVKSSGDQSPSEAKLVLVADRIYWVLDGSGERWFAFKTHFHAGDQWRHVLRGGDQQYQVTDADLTVTVPAGTFKHCAKVTISWIAHEHDMEGLQRRVLYLAPHLGIIKQEVWAGNRKYHEEVLTRYSAGMRN
jgi:hypothetical protein